MKKKHRNLFLILKKFGFTDPSKNSWDYTFTPQTLTRLYIYPIWGNCIQNFLLVLFSRALEETHSFQL
jgi:hypothetical protein